MGRRDERFIILLDFDKVFSAEELSIVQAAGDNADVPKPLF